MAGSSRSAGFALGVALLVASCGDPAPTTTTAPTPEPTAAPTPTPAPTPLPTPTPEPEPTPNTNRPVRLNLSLYSIEDPQGNFYPPNPADLTLPVGWTARMDVTARDENNQVTYGRGRVDFFVSNQAVVRMTGNQSHQRRLIGLINGDIDVWATQDGVRSNTVTIYFR